MKKTYEAFDWKSLLEDGPIIGVDEVGRGCLAGRVYAAACILNLKKDICSSTLSSSNSCLTSFSTEVTRTLALVGFTL